MRSPCWYEAYPDAPWWATVLMWIVCAVASVAFMAWQGRKDDRTMRHNLGIDLGRDPSEYDAWLADIEQPVKEVR